MPPRPLPLRVLKGSRRFHREGTRVVGRSDRHEWVEVTLKLRRAAPLPEPNPRGKPSLTRATLASKYGTKAADIDIVESTLSKLGVRVLSVHPASRSMRVAGPVSTIERVFGVHLLHVVHEGRSYRGRVGDIHLPPSLAGVVIGVFGLDNRPMVRRRHDVRAARRDVPPPNARAWFLPQELAAAYNFPDGDGSGLTIGLIELGGRVVDSDLKTFARAANLPRVAKVMSVEAESRTSDSIDDADSTGEVMLDVEVLASLCPAATIVAYFANFTEEGWINVIDAAIHDTIRNPSVLSVSWGLAEGDNIWTGQAMAAVNDALKEAATLGIPVCIAAGDDGSSDQVTDGRAYVDFPSSSPYALCVGGTALQKGADHNEETVWKDGDGLRADGGGSTGGGVSAVFARPDWQKAIDISSVNPGAIAGRCVPDVAANAAGSTGYFMVAGGKSQVSGGTSAAAPLWAGLLARINAQLDASKRLNYLTPLLYAPVSKSGKALGEIGCNDITQGDNDTAAAGGYSAGPGYDAVTGWGSPNGTALLQALAGAPATSALLRRKAHSRTGRTRPRSA
jgi:kumamolisin